MPSMNIVSILSYVLAIAVGVLIYFIYAKLNISKANVSAEKIIDDANTKADNLVKEAILDAKTQAYELKLEAEKEIKEQRHEIIVKMAEIGVACNVHYKPLPMMTAYKNMGFDIKDYPNAYKRFENEITLPSHTKLTDEEVEYVIEKYCEIVKEYL